MKELYEKIKSYLPENEQEKNDQRIMLKYLNHFDDVLTRKNEMFHLTTSAWVVNKDRSKVLMVYHNIFDSWSWIGGHADGNPDLLQVAKREILEETGVSDIKAICDDIFGLSIHAVKSHMKKGKFVSSHLHYDVQFLFELSEKEATRISPFENSGVQWIDVDSILDKVTEEHMKPIYEKLINKVKKCDL